MVAVISASAVSVPTSVRVKSSSKPKATAPSAPGQKMAAPKAAGIAALALVSALTVNTQVVYAEVPKDVPAICKKICANMPTSCVQCKKNNS